VGLGPNLQEEVLHAKQPKVQWRVGQQLQEDRLAVLPAEDGVLPNGAIPQLDKELTHPAMLVVPVPNADPGLPPQGVPRVEAVAEDSVGGGEEGDWEREGLVEDLRPAG